MPPEEDRATATGDVNTKFRADQSGGFQRYDCGQTQTDRQTDGLITILRTPTGVE